MTVARALAAAIVRLTAAARAAPMAASAAVTVRRAVISAVASAGLTGVPAATGPGGRPSAAAVRTAASAAVTGP
jgi:hypothetical protein